MYFFMFNFFADFINVGTFILTSPINFDITSPLASISPFLSVISRYL
jgi:hypothetical protein